MTVNNISSFSRKPFNYLVGFHPRAKYPAEEKPFQEVVKEKISDLSQTPGAKKIKKAYRAGTQIINESTVGLTDKILSTIRSVASLGEQIFRDSSFVAKSIQSTRLFVIAGIPFSFYNLYVGAKDLALGTKNEKVDAGLMMTSEVASLGDCTATFASGLEIIGAIGEASVWIGPLSAASAGLSIAAIIAQAKGWAESHHFLKDFLGKHGMDRTSDFEYKDYEKAIKFLQSKNNNTLNKHFKVNGKKLRGKIDEVWSKNKEKIASSNPEESKQAKSKLSTALKLLKNRIKVKNWTHAFSIAASIICLVAIAALLCSPFAPAGLALLPVGWALLALSGSMGIGKFAFERAMTHRFKKAFGMFSNQQP